MVIEEARNYDSQFSNSKSYGHDKSINKSVHKPATHRSTSQENADN